MRCRLFTEIVNESTKSKSKRQTRFDYFCLAVDKEDFFVRAALCSKNFAIAVLFTAKSSTCKIASRRVNSRLQRRRKQRCARLC